MGYIFIGVLMIVLLGVLIAILARSSSKPPRGTVSSDKPVGVQNPAADEPTPGASSTASSQQAEQARKRTPPA